MIASAITGGDVKIINCLPKQVETLTFKLRQAGATVEEAKTSLRVISGEPLSGVNIKTQPHPGFATDLQAQFMALMTLARGQSIIIETIFENREKEHELILDPPVVIMAGGKGSRLEPFTMVFPKPLTICVAA